MGTVQHARPVRESEPMAELRTTQEEEFKEHDFPMSNTEMVKVQKGRLSKASWALLGASKAGFLKSWPRNCSKGADGVRSKPSGRVASDASVGVFDLVATSSAIKLQDSG